MKNQGNYINYSEHHFTSEAERKKYLNLSKNYWTDDIFISINQRAFSENLLQKFGMLMDRLN